MIKDKTLVAWVYLANLTQRGGSVLTLDDQKSHFDGIVFGEISPGKWMAGSDFFRRTHKEQETWPSETADPDTLVQIAIVYRGKQITVYRNGKQCSQHEIVEPQTFGEGTAVLMGLRHIEAGDRACFAGAIEEARIYDVVLTADQIGALKPNRLSDPKPLSWWNFEDGKATDRMGTFPLGKLVGDAHIANGKLHLSGNDSYMIAPESAAPKLPAVVPYYASPIHYRPNRGQLADTIPFFWKGECHIFYLHGGIGKVPWKHIVSTDLVRWKELPDALLPDGDPNGPDGEHMFTGSVTEKDGTFHIFYTGWNPRNSAGREVIMHATSPDLITWTKHPEDALRPDGVYYKNHQDCDWRDAYVFWNEDEQRYWMVMCSNTAQGEGGVGLLVSKDLKQWKHEPPLKGTDQQECPDLFKIGDTWYLIGGDHYSYAKNPRGPYMKPPVCNTIDRPGIYAGKRMFDGKRHRWTGWVWDIPSHCDGEAGMWGGAQCLPRELYAGPEGQLYCKPVDEVVALFKRTVLDLNRKPKLPRAEAGWRYEGAALVGAATTCAFEVPDHYILECSVRLDPNAELDIALRLQTDAQAYHFTLNPARKQSTLSGPGFTYDRPCPVDTSKLVKIRIFVQGTIIECFVNDQYAQTCRAYNYQEGRLGLQVTGGQARIASLRVKVAPSKPRHYHAEGLYHWDTWYAPVGNKVHMFHLQVRRPDSTRPQRDHGSIGHAVTEDLIHWKELPIALRKGPPGSYDDSWDLFTGCAVQNNKTLYLFYCGNHVTQDGRNRQSMCLATSQDGISFHRYEGNPIIEPDPDVYYTIHEPPPSFTHAAHPHIDCRDLSVVKNPTGEGWLGYVVMRRKKGADAFRSACIALCRSKDLVHWEVGQPCCTPNRFNCFEVPDVFELDREWYMIALTGDAYGQSGRWSDPNITSATIVFQADRPEGPFEEVKDNLLLASTDWQGFSARTVEWKHERLMFFTRSEVPARGRLSWPVKLMPRKEGGLNPMYWHGIDKVFGKVRKAPDVETEDAKWVSVRGLPSQGGVYMITATANLKDASAAGVAFGQSTQNDGGFVVLLDAGGGPRGQVCLATTPDLKPVQNRHWPIRRSGPHKLRLLVVDRMVDVYIDEVLVINFYLPELTTGGISVYSENGTARVSSMEVFEQ